jgi:hypothetical protein
VFAFAYAGNADRMLCLLPRALDLPQLTPTASSCCLRFHSSA